MLHKIFIFVLIGVTIFSTTLRAEESCKSGYVMYNGKCMRTSEGCEGKCNLYYDEGRKTMYSEIKKEYEGQSVSMGGRQYENFKAYVATGIETEIVGEGLTPASYAGGSKLVILPSSATSVLSCSKTIDLSNVQSTGRFDVASCNTSGTSLIVDSDMPGTLRLAANWGASNYNIQCKGASLDICRNKVVALSHSFINVGVDYYKGYDENGNIIEEWTEQGKRTYSYASNGDYTIYDENGKSLGNFMANGEKRRIYHVDEAVAVVSKNGKNTFSIKYR